MNAHFYLIIILSLSATLSAMEPQKPVGRETTFTLVSETGKEFKVPLESAEQALRIRNIIVHYDMLSFSVKASSEIVAEIAQLMQMLYQNKNLTQAQIINKAEQEIEIPIKDYYAFAVIVKYLDFQPGIALISKKYAKRGNLSFPKDDYEYYMKLIHKISPLAYEKLRACEAVNNYQCLAIALDKKDEAVKQLSFIAQRYPILYINPALKLMPEVQRDFNLNFWLREYIEAPIAPGITLNEQKKIMEIIKGLAPALYAAIVAVDPYGARHMTEIEPPTNAAVEPSMQDGLPIIGLGFKMAERPKEELRFAIAHELGHYALGHFERPSPVHKVLQKDVSQEPKKGQKFSGQLPFKESFEHAFSRVQEFEADRFAIIEFGINIDEAIAVAKSWISEESKLVGPEKTTFERTHPHSIERVKQLEELRREVELHKAQKRQPKQMNWKELAANYLKS